MNLKLLRSVIRKLFMKKPSAGDPYSSNLAYFFTEVAKLYPAQLRLFEEYQECVELRPYIDMQKNKKGTILGFTINNNSEYEAVKKKLH